MHLSGPRVTQRLICAHNKRHGSFKGSWVQFNAVRLQTCFHFRFLALNVMLGIQALLPRLTAMLLVVHVLPWTVALECEQKNEFCLEKSTRLTPPIWRWRHFYNLRNPSLNRHHRTAAGARVPDWIQLDNCYSRKLRVVKPNLMMIVIMTRFNVTRGSQEQ